MLYERLATRQDIAGAVYDDNCANQQYDDKGQRVEQQMLQHAFAQLPLTGSRRTIDDDDFDGLFEPLDFALDALLAAGIKRIITRVPGGLTPGKNILFRQLFQGYPYA